MEKMENIVIRFISGLEININIESDKTIGDLKQIIYENKDLWTEDESSIKSFNDKPFVCRQQIIYKDNILNDDELISSLGGESTIQLDILIGSYELDEEKVDLSVFPNIRIGDYCYVFFTCNIEEDENFEGGTN